MNDRLYALVDSARDADVMRSARDRQKLEMAWLFRDGTSAEMQDVAPYLVAVDYRSRYPYPGSAFLDLWASRLGNSVGLLIIGPSDFSSLKSHLQEMFHVEDIDGKPFYFRFYDPRVVRTYLPTCTPAEARIFFGPMRRILVESVRPGRILSCGAERTGVKIDERGMDSVA